MKCGVILEVSTSVSDKGERASEDNKGTEDDEMADVELARDG